MSKGKKPDMDWKKALGASRTVSVRNAKGRSPVDLLALCEEISTRIRSTGGRPTDPAWTVERQVPFREETWKALKKLAAQLRIVNAKVSPAQLAALLIERAVAALQEMPLPKTETDTRAKKST